MKNSQTTFLELNLRVPRVLTSSRRVREECLNDVPEIIDVNSVIVKTDLNEEHPDDVHEEDHESEAEAGQPQRDRQELLDVVRAEVRRLLPQ